MEKKYSDINAIKFFFKEFLNDELIFEYVRAYARFEDSLYLLNQEAYNNARLDYSVIYYIAQYLSEEYKIYKETGINTGIISKIAENIRLLDEVSEKLFKETYDKRCVTYDDVMDLLLLYMNKSMINDKMLSGYEDINYKKKNL